MKINFLFFAVVFILLRIFICSVQNFAEICQCFLVVLCSCKQTEAGIADISAKFVITIILCLIY